MKINKEKFLEAINQLENHQNNKVSNNQEEVKEALEKIIRKVEILLRESNSEFEESLISSVNFEEDIFEKIEELNSQEAVEEKEQEIFLSFFTFYYFSLVGEEAVSINNKGKLEALISILEVFQQRKIFPLSTIYQKNKEKIEDTIEILKAISLSLDEPEEIEKVIPSSSKGKEVEKSSFSMELNNQSLINNALKRVNKDNIIELQKRVIEEKDKAIEEQKKEIEKLRKELAAEAEKTKQLKLELENLQKEKLESKTEILPK